MYIPDQGDVVWLNFEPSTGKEIRKRRPAFVLSRQAFNDHTGFVVAAPITSTVRGMKLEVVLDGMETTGAVLIHQIRSLDYKARQIELIEQAPEEIVRQVSGLAKVILS